jgi:beta-glucosidase
MSKNKRPGKTGVIVWGSVSTFLIVILLVGTILITTVFNSIITTALGGKTPVKAETDTEYYKSDYSSKEESKAAGDALNIEIASEGFVMLLNEDNALPIATPETEGSSVSVKPKVSVFGKNSVDLVLGGTGSGGISGESSKTLYDSLEASGFEYNKTLKSFYENDNLSGSGRSESPDLPADGESVQTLSIGETPVKKYTSDIRSSFNDYNDVAIVVISRLGGENWDLPRAQDTANGGIAGNHYLQLDQNEYDLLDMVTSKFDKVVVLLNTLTSFQCDFISEYNNTASNKRIDAVLWIGGPGTTGAMAVGEILNGNVNPSGKLNDLYSADFTADPTYQNFGDNSQVNSGADGSAFIQNNSSTSYYMVSYEEGIYVGYRYYETRAYEEKQKNASSTWYEDNVIFPFGYGLSYTSFEQKIDKIEGDLNSSSGQVKITVTTTNVGNVAGKDVIELYVNKPYTSGGIEKSYVELVDYAKSGTLKKGESYTVTFTVDAYDLASYDYNDANGNGFSGYELENGDYTFYVSSDSHVVSNAYDSKTVTVSATSTYGDDTLNGVIFATDTTTGYTVENRYSDDDFTSSDYRLSDVDVNGETRKGMSRTDFVGTFPTAPTEEERNYMTDSNNKSEETYLADKTHNNTAVAEQAKEYEANTSGSSLSSSTLLLKDLLDETGHVTYEDPRWEDILNELTFSEMLSLVNNGAFQTVAIESIGKNLTNDSDGPVGFVNFINKTAYKGNTTFVCESVLGATWSKDLAYQMGKIVGDNGLWGDVSGNGLPYSGWYAPAVNLHRSPFAGRNFEYYSEDPILSGKMAVNVINGAATKGVYTDLKHFALNDQETNRSGIATYCTEQALRELYLKPFEIAVKADDDATQVASAVKDGVTKYQGTTGIMSSFNRIGTRWTGGDYRLLTEILRNEWGFQGLVISDYKTGNSYMDSRQMLYAGNDLILASLPGLLWNDASSTSAEDIVILRQSTKNILYTVANSNSVNVEIVGYKTEWWMTTLIVVDCVVPVAIAVWGFFAIRKFLKSGKED